MALDWLPIFPDLVPHRRRVVSDLAPLYTAVVIPAVQADGFLAFLPTYPDQVPHHRSQAARTETVQPPPALVAALLTQSWRPIYPDRVPHRRLAGGSHPNYQSTTYGDVMVVAQQQAWKADFPDRVPTRRTPTRAGGPSVSGFTGGGTYTTPPAVAAAGPPLVCVDLAGDEVGSSTFLGEALAGSTLIGEAESSATFLSEGIC